MTLPAIGVLLVVLLGLALLWANAMNKLPAWPWGLVLFLLYMLGMR